MTKRRAPRTVPLQFDDGFRGAIAVLASLPLLVPAFWLLFSSGQRPFELILILVCAGFTLFFVVYLVWTHHLFTSRPDSVTASIAQQQHRARASRVSRLLGLRSSEEWAMFAAASAMLVAVLASVVGAGAGTLLLPTLILSTVVCSWVTVAYAFALRYFRLHRGGETIAFDIEEEPRFEDFLTMAVMVSSVGAMSADTPRTRQALTAVRTHTIIAFAFNALVVAMVVSLITGFVATRG